jgi:hypothetical protein
MSAGFNRITDLYDSYHTVQNTMIRYPKDLFIASLKEFFKRDSKYHYVSDEWGFNKTPDHTDLAPDAGLYDDLTTRVFIGEQSRYDVIFYPAIIVKSGSFQSKPISMNRDQYRVEHKYMEFADGYGNRRFTLVPDKFVLAGAWEGSIAIEVQSRGLRERDDLIELISMYFIDFNWNNLSRAGVSVKPGLSIGSPSEGEDRNDKLFKQSVDVQIRGEWRREIPITDIIETINFCAEIGSFASNGGAGTTAPNLEINTISNLESAIFDDNQIRIEPEDDS